MPIRISTPVAELLSERGLLPKHCRNIQLSVPAAGPMILTFEVFVTTDHLDILGEVFTAQAEEARREDREREARLAVIVDGDDSVVA